MLLRQTAGNIRGKHIIPDHFHDGVVRRDSMGVLKIYCDTNLCRAEGSRPRYRMHRGLPPGLHLPTLSHPPPSLKAAPPRQSSRVASGTEQNRGPRRGIGARGSAIAGWPGRRVCRGESSHHHVTERGSATIRHQVLVNLAK